MAKAKNGKVAGVAIGIVAVLGVGLGGAALIKQISGEKTKEVSSTFGYETGLLDAETGREKTGATAWRTKDFIPVKGLVVDMSEDNSDISYNIYYYDADKAFLSKTSASLKVDYTASKDSSLPSDAKYVRIVFEHANDTDISSGDIRSYAKEYTVSYDK